MTVAEKLRYLLDESGLKQYVFAQRLGYQPKTFSDILNNRKKITEQDIVQLCARLEMRPDELIDTDTA